VLVTLVLVALVLVTLVLAASVVLTIGSVELVTLMNGGSWSSFLVERGSLDVDDDTDDDTDDIDDDTDDVLLEEEELSPPCGMADVLSSTARRHVTCSNLIFGS